MPPLPPKLRPKPQTSDVGPGKRYADAGALSAGVAEWEQERAARRALVRERGRLRSAAERERKLAVRERKRKRRAEGHERDRNRTGLGKGDIGEWLAAPPRSGGGPTSPGELVLLDPSALAAATDLPSAAVAEILRGACGPPLPRGARGACGPPLPRGARAPGSSGVQELRGALGPAQRARLVAWLEDARARSSSADTRRDLKLEIPEAELRGLVGRASVDALAGMGREQLRRAAGGIAAPAARLRFKLRRRAAVEGTEHERIPFHRDVSLAVVNVALNDDFEGARLIFAIGDRLVVPTRAAGDATAHDWTVVHAVSRLAAGVRYNLYGVFEAAPAPTAA